MHFMMDKTTQNKINTLLIEEKNIYQFSLYTLCWLSTFRHNVNICIDCSYRLQEKIQIDFGLIFYNMYMLETYYIYMSYFSQAMSAVVTCTMMNQPLLAGVCLSKFVFTFMSFSDLNIKREQPQLYGKIQYLTFCVKICFKKKKIRVHFSCIWFNSGG